MALLTALFVQITRIGQPGSASAPGGRSRKHEQVEKFRGLVEQHFKQRLGLPDYADRVGVSAGQLARVCREVLGVSALDVINARILHEAQRNLIYTSGSVKQLASALGFVDEAYFGRFFRKHTGLTPREFRAKAQEGPTAARARPWLRQQRALAQRGRRRETGARCEGQSAARKPGAAAPAGRIRAQSPRRKSSAR